MSTTPKGVTTYGNRQKVQLARRISPSSDARPVGSTSSFARTETSSQSSSELSSAGQSPDKRRRLTPPESVSEVENGVTDEDGEREMDLDVEAGPSGNEDGHQAEASKGHLNGDQSEGEGADDEVVEEEDCEWSDLDDGGEDGKRNGGQRPILHVEIRRMPIRQGRVLNKLIQGIVQGFLNSSEDVQLIGSEVDLEAWGNETLIRNIDRLYLAETEPPSETVIPSKANIRYHFYEPSGITDLEQFTAVTEDDDADEAVPAASVRELPSMELEGIWENLIYTSDLKPKLLRYINSTMAFSEARVDFNKVSWNRLVLLHGPPGTGKTSLCRALAQKLLVRMGDTYRTGKLVEINSHSLFSKWFSESGKLVQKLFSRVGEMVEDQRCLVVVMIDEVESLTAARSAAINGSEPSDALRVVNALLTQLDKLKTRQNVLVLTTSNIPDTIDSAFIDRADEKFFVDYPPPEAVYWILKGCLEELDEKGMMRPCGVSSVLQAKHARSIRGRVTSPDVGEVDLKRRLQGKERELEAGVALWDIAVTCHDANLAGRFLRRLPLLAHSHYLMVTTKTDDDGRPISRTIERWLEAFRKVVRDEIGERARIGKKTHTTLGKVEGDQREGSAGGEGR